MPRCLLALDFRGVGPYKSPMPTARSNFTERAPAARFFGPGAFVTAATVLASLMAAAHVVAALMGREPTVEGV